MFARWPPNPDEFKPNSALRYLNSSPVKCDTCGFRKSAIRIEGGGETEKDEEDVSK